MLSLPRKNESLVCAAALLLWLCVTALFVGFRPEHPVLALLIFALFFLNGATRRLVVALIPFILFGISYDWMNICPNYKVNPVDIEGLYNAEKSLFGITVASGETLTPNEFFAVHHCAAADFMAGVFYLCWVPLPIFFGLWLYFTGKRAAYLHFALVFLFVNLIGFAGYYIHPAAPPWYAAAYGPESEAIPGTLGQVAGMAGFDNITGLNIFHGLYSRNANVFAAVPSLHSAYCLVAFIYAVKSKSPLWIKITLFVISCGIWWAAVYSSHHYVIDVLLGILTALLGWVVFEYILMKWPAFRNAINSYKKAITPAVHK